MQDVIYELKVKQSSSRGTESSPLEIALEYLSPDDIDQLEISLHKVKNADKTRGVKPVVSVVNRCDPSERSEASRAKTF